MVIGARCVQRQLPVKCLRRLVSNIRSLPLEMQPIIGLEIHVQLNTEQKLFSSPAKSNAPPNMLVGYHDIGLPGSLPLLNKCAVRLAVQAALLLNCKVNRYSSFDRKHYFYKDLPHGYQITQHYHPLAVDGNILVHAADDTTEQLKESFSLPITRIQLEEDTAKTLQTALNLPADLKQKFQDASPHGKKYLFIDHNRASIPLIEIVTPPVLHSPLQAAAAFAKVIDLLRSTGITSGRLEFGALRCDANVSLGRDSPRTEIKNLFSVRALRDACTFEINEQIQNVLNNSLLTARTKNWDGTTMVDLRDKETEKDYRYLPDADLPPIVLDEEFITEAESDLPDSPDVLVAVLLKPPNNLRLAAAKRFSENPNLLKYYNAVMERSNLDGPTVANWIEYELLPQLDRRSLRLEDGPFTVEHMVDLLQLRSSQQISRSYVSSSPLIIDEAARLLMREYLSSESPPNVPPSQHRMLRESNKKTEDESLHSHVEEILKSVPPPRKVRGMESLETYYMGQLRKAKGKQIDGKSAAEIIRHEIANSVELDPLEGGYFAVKFREKRQG